MFQIETCRSSSYETLITKLHLLLKDTFKSHVLTKWLVLYTEVGTSLCIKVELTQGSARLA